MGLRRMTLRLSKKVPVGRGSVLQLLGPGQGGPENTSRGWEGGQEIRMIDTEPRTQDQCTSAGQNTALT